MTPSDTIQLTGGQEEEGSLSLEMRLQKGAKLFLEVDSQTVKVLRHGFSKNKEFILFTA